MAPYKNVEWNYQSQFFPLVHQESDSNIQKKVHLSKKYISVTWLVRPSHVIFLGTKTYCIEFTGYETREPCILLSFSCTYV